MSYLLLILWYAATLYIRLKSQRASKLNSVSPNCDRREGTVHWLQTAILYGLGKLYYTYHFSVEQILGMLVVTPTYIQ